MKEELKSEFSQAMSNRILFSITDVVTSYYSGYFKIIGFHSKSNPQAILSQICDSKGNIRKSIKSCHVDYLKHANSVINDEIKKLQKTINALTNLKNNGKL